MLTQRSATATRPAARFENLVVTETADEVLLYDTAKHHIHHLNATTAAVWRLCDGRHTVVDLAREAAAELGAEMDEATVRLALTRLDDVGLLRESLVDELRVSRLSRRTFMQRAGVAGAIAVPAIVSTTASTAAQIGVSQTSCGVGCNAFEDCQIGAQDCPFCVDNICDDEVPSPTCGCACSNSGDCPGYYGPSECNVCYVPGTTQNCTGGACNGNAGVCWHGTNLGPAPLSGSVCGESLVMTQARMGDTEMSTSKESQITTGTASISATDSSTGGTVYGFCVVLEGTGLAGCDGSSGTATIFDVPAGGYSVVLASQDGGGTMASGGWVEVPAGGIGHGTVTVSMPSSQQLSDSTSDGGGDGEAGGGTTGTEDGTTEGDPPADNGEDGTTGTDPETGGTPAT